MFFVLVALSLARTEWCTTHGAGRTATRGHASRRGPPCGGFLGGERSGGRSGACDGCSAAGAGGTAAVAWTVTISGTVGAAAVTAPSARAAA